MIRIAHISDLHFSKFSYSPTQFFSKRWLGNGNLLLSRAKDYLNERPFSLIPAFKKSGITHVIISGDLTTTSSRKEYALARSFVEALEKENIRVFLIPGNHDHYTKRADKTKAFYRSFPSSALSKYGVEAHPLTEGWHLVLIDTACATSLTSSNGLFSPVIEANLQALLKKIPPEEKVILVNHFPFFQHDRPRRLLLRGDKLRQLIQSFPNIQIYLHGHTHRRTIADLRPNGLPLILDSGSSGHRKGSWNQLDLEGDALSVTVHAWDQKWEEIDHQTFSFETGPWYRSGLRFKCTGCGKCCTGSGFVWLEDDDVKNLANHLEITEELFYKKYTRQVGLDTSLIDDPQTTDCIFLRDKKFCAVYDARPKQCRSFPWWEGNLESHKDWKEAGKRCEGIDHEDAPLISLSKILKEKG